MEDQVGVGQREGPNILYVMAKNAVREPKEGGGTVGKVTDDEPVGLASSLVHDDNVRHTLGFARIHNLGDGVSTSIHPLCIGDDQSKLLCKLCQPRTGITCCCNEDYGILCT